MGRRLLVLTLALCVGAGAASLYAEQTESKSASSDDGYALPNSERFRMRVELAAYYGRDEAENSRLGFEAQGRIGWAIVSFFGKLSDRFSHRIDVNPVDETSPLPACGTPTFFYPNAARWCVSGSTSAVTSRPAGIACG